MSVVEAIRADLARLGKRDLALAEGGLAAAALALAERLDDPSDSATSKANCAKALLELMTRLEALAPTQVEKEGIDELRRKRQRRRAG